MSSLSLLSSSVNPMKNLFWVILLSLLPAAVFGKCTCEAIQEDRNVSLAIKYKLAAIASILAAGGLGVCLPSVGRRVPALNPERNFYFIIKAFAAGVILSTGFLHVMSDAFENLTSPCISKNPWEDFPFTGFIAMLSAIGMLLVDTYANLYYNQRRRSRANVPAVDSRDEERPAVPLNTRATHGDAQGSASLELASGESEPVGRHVISQVLEGGILVHSLIITFALGASESPKTIRPLNTALIFHQFFEGIGLGRYITQARLHPWLIFTMTSCFALITPLGILFGISITNIYGKTSSTALIVEGIFNSASAGILIYMALVDLLSADFLSPSLQRNEKLRIGATASLFIGAGCMSLLAKLA